MIITPGTAILEFGCVFNQMRSAPNSPLVWELTTEGERPFHRGTARGKKEPPRASPHVRYLQHWAPCDDLADPKLRAGVRYPSPPQTQHQNVPYEREAGRTDPHGPQEMATQAHQTSRQHHLRHATPPPPPPVLEWFSGKELNDRNYCMNYLHESMGLGRDRTHYPWICSQACICCQTR